MTLPEFFRAHPRAAVACSGGVDSALVLYEARRAGADVVAYFVQSEFQPAFELRDAQALAVSLGIALHIVPLALLPALQDNGPRRCYDCKRRMLEAIRACAQRDGFGLLLDGTNASDPADDRPGMQALRELGVRSPLRECGIGKAEVRARAREAGLPCWDKPAYACLATRIAPGEPITREKLAAVERAEEALFSLGFSDLRVRSVGGTARLELREADLPRLLAHRGEILAALRPDFSAVTLNLEVRHGF